MRRSIPLMLTVAALLPGPARASVEVRGAGGFYGLAPAGVHASARLDPIVVDSAVAALPMVDSGVSYPELRTIGQLTLGVRELFTILSASAAAAGGVARALRTSRAAGTPREPTIHDLLPSRLLVSIDRRELLAAKAAAEGRGRIASDVDQALDLANAS